LNTIFTGASSSHLAVTGMTTGTTLLKQMSLRTRDFCWAAFPASGNPLCLGRTLDRASSRVGNHMPTNWTAHTVFVFSKNIFIRHTFAKYRGNNVAGSFVTRCLVSSCVQYAEQWKNFERRISC
jgi:hypothetical protein